jgi:hypothetical protein
MIEAIVAALKLTHVQHDHLSRLAGFTPIRGDTVPRDMTYAVERLVSRINDTPLAVFDAAWSLVAWNQLWKFLVGSRLTDSEGRERNLIWRRFTGLSTTAVDDPDQEERFETAIVADLRAASIRYPKDRFVTNMVTDLLELSPRFADLWAQGDFAHHQSATKTLDHPVVGELTVDIDVLTIDGSEVRVVIYTVDPGSNDADKLEQIARLGTVDRVRTRPAN